MSSHSGSFDKFDGILSLWLVWMLSTGALTLADLSPIFLKPLWVPVITLVLGVVLLELTNRNVRRRHQRCFLTPFITSRALILSSLLMAVVLFLQTKYPHLLPGDSYNPDIPFLPVLIISPVTFLLGFYAKWKKENYGYCAECVMSQGTSSERGFLGEIFTQEGRYQVKLLTWLSLFISVVSWGYYLLRYINVNLNNADLYFFFGIVLALFICGAIYTALRYFSVYHYHSQDLLGSHSREGNFTRVRYIIIHDNTVFLIPPANSADMIADISTVKVDTPASVSIAPVSSLSSERAENLLREAQPLANPRVRFMYESESADGRSNIFHYLVFVDDKDAAALTGKYSDGMWLTMYEANKLTAVRALAPLMSAEIYRLYTILMAYKTYRPDGSRLYPVKHYHPTFRFCDVEKYDVDYNNPRWLRVARDNEDRRFFKLRSLWRRKIRRLDY